MASAQDHIEAVLRDYEAGYLPLPDKEDEDAFDAVVTTISQRVIMRMLAQEDLGDYLRTRRDPSDARPANILDWQENHIAPLVRIQLESLVAACHDRIERAVQLPEEPPIDCRPRTQLHLEEIDTRFAFVEKKHVLSSLYIGISAAVITFAVGLGISLSQKPAEPPPTAVKKHTPPPSPSSRPKP